MASGDRPDTAPKPKNPSRKLTQKEQSERFIATARELEADEEGGEFERALDKVLPAFAARKPPGGGL